MMRIVSVFLVVILVSACGRSVETNEIPKPYNRMMSEEAAIAGNSEAKRRYGNAYIRGEDGARNFTTGTKWLCKAAREGNIHAQYDLALFYQSLADRYPTAPASDGMDYSPGYDMVAYAWYEIAQRNQAGGANAGRVDMLEDFTIPASNVAIAMADAFPDTPCEYPVCFDRTQAVDYDFCHPPS